MISCLADRFFQDVGSNLPDYTQSHIPEHNMFIATTVKTQNVLNQTMCLFKLSFSLLARLCVLVEVTPAKEGCTFFFFLFSCCVCRCLFLYCSMQLCVAVCNCVLLCAGFRISV